MWANKLFVCTIAKSTQNMLKPGLVPWKISRLNAIPQAVEIHGYRTFIKRQDMLIDIWRETGRY